MKPLFHGLIRGEPLSTLQWWIGLRWGLLGAALLTALWGSRLPDPGFPTAGVLGAGLAGALLNAGFHFRLAIIRRKTAPDMPEIVWLTRIFLATEPLLMGVLFHLTGGAVSPLLLYAVLHATLAGGPLELRSALLYAGSVVAGLVGAVFWEWPPQGPGGGEPLLPVAGVHPNPWGIGWRLVLFAAVVSACLLWVSSLFRHLRENRRQLSGLPRSLPPAKGKLELLHEVANITSSTLGLKPRLDFICGSVRELMGVKGVTVRLLNDRTGKLELMSSCGLSPEYLNKGPVDADKSLAGVLKGEPQFVADAPHDPSAQYPQEAAREGIVSILSFPLQGRRKVIGALRLYTAAKREFTAEEMDFLSSLAGQGAIYIENARIYDALKKQDEAKNEFILMMTHELKGPLMAVQGFMEVMQKGYAGTVSEKQMELLGRVQKRIEAVMGVSAELLDLYQWQTRDREAKVAPISLTRQLEKALDLYGVVAQEKGVSLKLELTREDFQIPATEEEVEKILGNLITNAMKYTPAGGAVCVSLARVAGRIQLRVKDTGIGVAAEDIPKVFQEFFRTRRAKRMDPDGSGLGLPLVKRIVDGLGGEITMQSVENQGSEVIVSFPWSA
jgi:signal transduction histidine kinase